MTGIIQVGIITTLLLIFTVLSTRRDRPDKPPSIFYRFWSHMLLCFDRVGILVLLASIVVTVLFVLSGWDYSFQAWLQHVDPLPKIVTWPMFLLGMLWTPVTGLVLLFLAIRRQDFRLRGGAAASLQAIIITFYVTHFLKVLSGRRGPDVLAAGQAKDGPFTWSKDASDFDFAFWTQAHGDGRFFWPSGHTATAVAFVAALVAFYPEKRWIAWIGYPCAAFMGWCMLDGDHHWISDVIAGAAIAHVIGWKIGKIMRTQTSERIETHTLN